MKRLISVAATLALAGLAVSGCAKSNTSDTTVNAAATGPVTDSASTGMKDAASTTVAMGDAKHGTTIFTANCASCHGANGAGGGVGPSLKGEKSRKDYAKTVAWIKNPQPPMPKLYPSPLSEGDVNDVAAYVQSL